MLETRGGGGYFHVILRITLRWGLRRRGRHYSRMSYPVMLFGIRGRAFGKRGAINSEG